MENENNEGFKKIVDFFISDDENHIPYGSTCTCALVPPRPSWWA
jgi:hypothetical protein